MKPILFNTDTVRALLADRKTVTRRVVKPQPIWDGGMWRVGDLTCGWGKNVKQIRFDRKHTMRGFTPPYRNGDILYVRETWAPSTGGIAYKADSPYDMHKWHPSIHMPREAARIFLRVMDVKVERLQEISGGDLLKEGIDLYQSRFVRAAFDEFTVLWDSTIKPADRAIYGWEADPWVWVIEFERISREEAENHAI